MVSQYKKQHDSDMEVISDLLIDFLNKVDVPRDEIIKFMEEADSLTSGHLKHEYQLLGTGEVYFHIVIDGLKGEDTDPGQYTAIHADHGPMLEELDEALRAATWSVLKKYGFEYLKHETTFDHEMLMDMEGKWV